MYFIFSCALDDCCSVYQFRMRRIFRVSMIPVICFIYTLKTHTNTVTWKLWQILPACIETYVFDIIGSYVNASYMTITCLPCQWSILSLFWILKVFTRRYHIFNFCLSKDDLYWWQHGYCRVWNNQSKLHQH